MSSPSAPPSPERFFETITGYQRAAALKGAVDLDLFSAIGGGAETAASLAGRCGASARGVRILCDYLTTLGFLAKEGDRYRLTPDSAAFLDRRSQPEGRRSPVLLRDPAADETRIDGIREQHDVAGPRDGLGELAIRARARVGLVEKRIGGLALLLPVTNVDGDDPGRAPMQIVDEER